MKNTHHELDMLYYMYGSSLRWIKDEAGEIMADKIIRFENLTELELILEDYGYCGKLPKINTGEEQNTPRQHHDYRKYYNELSIKLVTENFKEDIDYFGYRFNLR